MLVHSETTYTLLVGVLCALCIGHLPWYARKLLQYVIGNNSEKGDDDVATHLKALCLEQHVQAQFRRDRTRGWSFIMEALGHLNVFAIFWALVRCSLIWTNFSVQKRKDAFTAEEMSRYIAFTLIEFLVLIFIRTCAKDWGWGCFEAGIARCYRLIEKMRPRNPGISSRLFESIVHFDRCQMLYVVIMVGCIILMVGVDCENKGSYKAISQMVRLTANVFNRSTSHAIVWTTNFHFVTLVWVQRARIVDTILEGDCEYTDWDSLWNLIVWDLFFQIIVTWAVEVMAMHEARCMVLVRCQRNERGALSAILNATCDAVVQLDNEKKVVASSPKLEAMLLLQGSSVAGAHFEQLFIHDDQKRILDLLNAEDSNSSSEDSFAKIFQGMMTDSMGNNIQIRGFHTQFTDLDGSVGHVVGMMESLDQLEMRSSVAPLITEVSTMTFSSGSQRSILPPSPPGGASVRQPQARKPPASGASAPGRRLPSRWTSGGPAAAAQASSAAPQLMTSRPSMSWDSLSATRSDPGPSASRPAPPVPPNVVGPASAMSAAARGKPGRSRSRRKHEPTDPSHPQNQIKKLQERAAAAGLDSDSEESGRSSGGDLAGDNRSVMSRSIKSLSPPSSCSGKSSTGSVVLAQGKLLHEGLLPTLQVAQEVALTKVLEMWNFECPRDACCHHHAALLHLHAVAEEMAKVECFTFNVCKDHQCQGCGLLHCRSLDMEPCNTCKEVHLNIFDHPAATKLALEL